MCSPDGLLWQCRARLLEVLKACLQVGELELGQVRVHSHDGAHRGLKRQAMSPRTRDTSVPAHTGMTSRPIPSAGMSPTRSVERAAALATVRMSIRDAMTRCGRKTRSAFGQQTTPTFCRDCHKDPAT